MPRSRAEPLGGIELAINDALIEGLKVYQTDPSNAPLPSYYVAEVLHECLTDDAVRREVHEAVQEEHLDREDVHHILDALVSVLYPTTEYPTTTEE